MKIAVEIDLEPDEIPMAAELLAVLQRITTHIRPADGTRIYERVFKQVIAGRIRPDDGGQRLRQLLQAFQAPEDTATAKANLFQAFVEVALVPEILAQDFALTTVMDALPHIGEPYVAELLQKLVPHLLTKLSKPRPGAVDRVEYFADAEAFAHVVRLDFIAVTAAMKAVTAMLRNAATRAAAMTILGKLTEICSDKIAANCEPAQLRELQTALSQVTEEALQYDVQYVTEHLLGSVGRGAGATPAATRSAGVASGRLRTAVPRSTFASTLTAALTGIAVDQLRDLVHGMSQTGYVVSWNSSGQECGRTHVSDGLIGISCDIQALDDTLLVAARSSKPDMLPPTILMYDLSASGSMSAAGPSAPRTLPLKASWGREAKIVSCIRALSRPGQFLASETPLKGKVNRIHLFDVSSRAGRDLSPICTWEEHEGVVTSLAQVPDSSHLFLSSSMDSTVRLWDVRRPNSSVAILGRGTKAATAGAGSSEVLGHTELVAQVDASALYAVSCDYKSLVLVWDMRNLSMAVAAPDTTLPAGSAKPLNNARQGALKLAVHPDNDCAALAIGNGIKLMRLPTCQLVDVAQFPGRQASPLTYSDVRWHVANQKLLASTQTGLVDVYDSDWA